MTNSITKHEIKPTDYIAVVTQDGPDMMGYVVGFAVSEEKDFLENIRRGELFDALGLFIDEEIPEDVQVEYDTVEGFYNAYDNRMPLPYEGIRL